MALRVRCVIIQKREEREIMVAKRHIRKTAWSGFDAEQCSRHVREIQRLANPVRTGRLARRDNDRVAKMIGGFRSFASFMRTDFGVEGRDDRTVTMTIRGREIEFNTKKYLCGHITNDMDEVKEIFVHIAHLLIDNGCLPELAKDDKPRRNGPMPAIAR